FLAMQDRRVGDRSVVAMVHLQPLEVGDYGLRQCGMGIVVEVRVGEVGDLRLVSSELHDCGIGDATGDHLRTALVDPKDRRQLAKGGYMYVQGLCRELADGRRTDPDFECLSVSSCMKQRVRLCAGARIRAEER